MINEDVLHISVVGNKTCIRCYVVNILYIYIPFFLSLSLPFLLVSWKKGGYVVCLPLCLHLNSFLEKFWH